jgi:hypothetical protein
LLYPPPVEARDGIRTHGDDDDDDDDDDIVIT